MEQIITVLNDSIALSLILVPVIVGIVEVAKKTGLPSQYASMTAIILGVILVTILAGLSVVNAIVGIVLGLSASGLWSVGKSVIK